ncbi:alkylhydroperoxidase domain protein [Aestuariimicrobium ganziense]|uniref:alkylhydroperoxidase domain protein n=1 Tax=Aestuariimicrobium ganziense TaxID=2773677 RepID=UPI001941D42B|nr:alkylhydroperoxidase domain protein [Aestuariimicrobium ganziense]
MTEILTHPDLSRPEAFTRAELGWVPWIEPSAAEDLSERQVESLVQPSRTASPYFRLLADDPDVVEARTKADLEIFQAKGGLERADRELAAAAVSRHNGCVFCASVHARFAAHYSKQPDLVDQLLDEGVGAELGQRWNAVVAASVALTDTPVAFGADQVTQLREAGLDDLEISDVVHSAGFFNWANRLMLSLGEPENPS